MSATVAVSPMAGGAILAGLILLWVTAFMATGATLVASVDAGWSQVRAVLFGACLLCLVAAPVAFWRVAQAAS